jgi:hypothetical protein
VLTERVGWGISASALKDDAGVLYQSFGTNAEIILRDREDAIHLSECITGSGYVSPSGKVVVCRARTIRSGSELLLEYDAAGVLLRKEEVTLPEGICVPHGVFFGKGNEEVVPLASCERGHAVYRGGSWTFVDNSEFGDPSESSLAAVGLLKPRSD